MNENVDGELQVVDNPTAMRYEARLDGTVVGWVQYRRQTDRLVLVHTQVEPAFQGRGIAGQLTGEALDDIRRRGLAVVPLCPYVVHFIRHHPEYQDLVVGGVPTREGS